MHGARGDRRAGGGRWPLGGYGRRQLCLHLRRRPAVPRSAEPIRAADERFLKRDAASRCGTSRFDVGHHVREIAESPGGRTPTTRSISSALTGRPPSRRRRRPVYEQLGRGRAWGPGVGRGPTPMLAALRRSDPSSAMASSTGRSTTWSPTSRSAPGGLRDVDRGADDPPLEDDRHVRRLYTDRSDGWMKRRTSCCASVQSCTSSANRNLNVLTHDLQDDRRHGLFGSPTDKLENRRQAEAAHEHLLSTTRGASSTGRSATIAQGAGWRIAGRAPDGEADRRRDLESACDKEISLPRTPRARRCSRRPGCGRSMRRSTRKASVSRSRC